MSQYGNGTVTAATQPDTQPTTIDANTADPHSWSSGVQRKVIISLLDDSDVTRLLIKYNGTASASDWDQFLTPGRYTPSPDGIHVASVSIYAVGADCTFGTEYQVQGWQ